MSKRVVVIGNMGSGKSTFCKRLSKEWGVKLYEEPVVDNPYLEKYYNDPHRYSFQLQTFMLHQRFLQQLDAKKLDAYVMDLSMDGNSVFTQVMYDEGYMSKEDYRLFNQMYHSYRELVDKPDLIVYLDCSPKECKSRMRLRGRSYENEVELSYLEHLEAVYEELYSTYPMGKRIRIPCDNLNLKTNDRDFKGVIDTIAKFL